MAKAREAFAARAGHAVRVHGATYTWGSLPSGHAELAFLVSVSDSPERLIAVEIPTSSDIVQAAAAFGIIAFAGSGSEMKT